MFGIHFNALDGAVVEGGTERVEVAVGEVGARCAAQIDATVLGHGNKGA